MYLLYIFFVQNEQVHHVFLKRSIKPELLPICEGKTLEELFFLLCLPTSQPVLGRNKLSHTHSDNLPRVRTGPGNPGKPWKIFEALEIPGNLGKALEFFL